MAIMGQTMTKRPTPLVARMQKNYQTNDHKTNIEEKINIERKKHEPVTSCIKHWGVNGYTKLLPRIGIRFGG